MANQSQLLKFSASPKLYRDKKNYVETEIAIYVRDYRYRWNLGSGKSFNRKQKLKKEKNIGRGKLLRQKQHTNLKKKLFGV